MTEPTGPDLVERILSRRRSDCITANTHTPNYCRACGIHQKEGPA